MNKNAWHNLLEGDKKSSYASFGMDACIGDHKVTFHFEGISWIDRMFSCGWIYGNLSNKFGGIYIYKFAKHSCHKFLGISATFALALLLNFSYHSITFSYNYIAIS